MSRCRFVEDHQADYAATRLCKLAGVSRSGFYAWRCRTPSKRALANDWLLAEIRDIHERSRGTYGRVKILGQLERRGLSANHKRVARLMRISGIRGVGGPAQRSPSSWSAPGAGARSDPPRLQRRPAGRALGRRHHRVRHLRGQAAPGRDRRSLLQPGRRLGDLRQTDRRALSCDRAYDEQVRLSFGRIGTAADNAAIEAFWSTLKRELRHLHGRRVWPDRASLRAALFDYIEIFYNRERHQAWLSDLTPAEYEQREIEIRV